ncbi:MAG: DUF502 domain-containing protein [Thiogranum sp.]|nr:DUF502 domain-containing protein [Thiogranum sp.]
MLKLLGRTLLTGLITILPVVLTLYLLYWLAVSAETVLGNLIRLILPQGMYWPGMGVVAGVVVTLLVGLLMHAYVVQRVFDKAEQLLYRVPLIKSVYRAMRDLFDFFSPSRKKEFEQVVAVSLDNGMQVIGFVTQAVPEQMPGDFRDEAGVLVYVPMSYMIGGFTVLMPRSAVRPLQMNMEEAMRFVLTAGVTGSGRSTAVR